MSLKIVDVHCGLGATAAASGWNDAAAVRAALAARRVSTAFLVSDLARRYDMTAGNEAVGDVVEGSVGADDVDLRGWLVVHPARFSDALEQMRRYLGTSRFVGAALFPDPLTGRLVSLQDAREMVASFRRYAKPLLIETPNAEAMAEVVQLSTEMSGVKIIASGMGGKEWRESVDMAVKPLNLFLDVSGEIVPERIEYAIETLNGTRKLLFASGCAPQTDPAAIVGLLYDVPLADEDRQKILSLNAIKMFRLEEEDEPEAVPGSDEGGLRPMQIGGLGALGE